MTVADLPYVAQIVVIGGLSVTALACLARVWWLVRQREAETRRLHAEWDASAARVAAIVDGRKSRSVR